MSSQSKSSIIKYKVASFGIQWENETNKHICFNEYKHCYVSLILLAEIVIECHISEKGTREI